MKWDGKVNSISREEVLKKNLKKIIKLQVNTVCIIFPYNQKRLMIPDKQFWHDLKKYFIICSPNALVKTLPLSKDYFTTFSEMVMMYWEEILMYLKANSGIKNILIVSSDINISRIMRDYSIVFKEFKEDRFNVKTRVIEVYPSFWKNFYKIREAIVSQLPIWLYKLLGNFS